MKNEELVISNWKTFRIHQLFDVILPKGDCQASKLPEGDIPLITSGKTNNGVGTYVACGDGISEIIKGNCITVDMFGNAFYRDFDFYCVSHGRVNILVPKFKCNKEIGAFFVTVIEVCTLLRFSFSNMCTSKKLSQEIIKIPVNNDGNPDFEYMQQYIKSFNVDFSSAPDYYLSEGYEKAAWYFENIDLDDFEKKYRPSLINSKPFRKFEMSTYRLIDLFDVKGTKTTKRELLDAYGAGTYPYVTTKSTNNGVDGFFDYYTEDGNVLTIDSAVRGYCSYQEHPFTASDHVEKLVPKFEMNKYIALFLVCIISKEMFRYDYGRKYNQANIKATKIQLPSKLNKKGVYEPDWTYMENYIKSLPYSSAL